MLDCSIILFLALLRTANFNFLCPPISRCQPNMSENKKSMVSTPLPETFKPSINEVVIGKFSWYLGLKLVAIIYYLEIRTWPSFPISHCPLLPPSPQDAASRLGTIQAMNAFENWCERNCLSTVAPRIALTSPSFCAASFSIFDKPVPAPEALSNKT